VKRTKLWEGTAYERAQYEYKRSGWYILVVALPSVGLVYATVSGIFPRLNLEAVAAVAAAILAFEAIMITRSSMAMALLQMMQAEEHRSTDLALTEAMRELAKELRRRPKVSSSVTFALFAAPGNRGNVESPIDGRGPGGV
jgi:hypothetical protein